MPGYRTIPTKDTFDVDERLGGLVTIKQLAYFIASFFAAYLAYIVLDGFLEPSDAFFWSLGVFLAGLLYTFSNMDKWLMARVNYYLLSDYRRLERNPALLRNVRTLEEDKIVTMDGRVMAVLKVTPINFPLLSDEAKEARIGAYEMYLRQLVYPIIHMVQSDTVDVDEYASNLLKSAQGAKGLGVRGVDEYVREHLQALRGYLASNRSRSKNHYVVLQVKDPRFRGRGAGDFGGSPPALLWASALLTEFQPDRLLRGGGKLFEKPANYVHLDLVGGRMVFKDPKIMPEQAPPRATCLGPVIQFETRVALLRYARGQEKRYYYGPIDLGAELKKEFLAMPLREREKEFTIDERRRHVQLSAGKTRWAYDEVEKHIAVLAEKLEATGLRVHRVAGEELYNGPHMAPLRVNTVRVRPNFLKVDSTFLKVVYATGYPYQVSLGWLNNIVDGREDYDLTMYIYPKPIQEVISTFKGAMLKLSTEKKAQSDFLDPETEQHLEDVKNFYTQIVSGKEKYFLCSLYITCKAPTAKALDTVLEKCKSDLAGASIDYGVADYNMARAAFSTRLTGLDLLDKKREFPSSSLAATFPHISSSLEIEAGGVFFGYDWMGAPIIFDLRKLPNQHVAITGESGSGKSYFAKSIIPRYLINGYRVFITDPDGEYTELVKHFGGEVSAVGPHGGAIINPFDVEGRDVNDKIRGLLGMFAIMCGSLSKYQEGLISDILIDLYDQRGKRALTMSDFASRLEAQMGKVKDDALRHEMQVLHVSLKPFLKGGLYGFVDKPTTVDLTSRLHVFDLREYRNDKTLRDFFNYIIFDFITHRLVSDRSLKALFMDEGWTMVNYPSSEQYVHYIIKDSRKYNVSFVFITQELEDMLQSPAGRSILNNTATQFIFRQKESAINLMKTTMNLTHEEYDRLLVCGKGEGLMVSDRSRLLFRVRTNPVEHAMISTDPNDRHGEAEEEDPGTAALGEAGAREERMARGPAGQAAFGRAPEGERGAGAKSPGLAGAQPPQAEGAAGTQAAAPVESVGLVMDPMASSFMQAKEEIAEGRAGRLARQTTEEARGSGARRPRASPAPTGRREGGAGGQSPARTTAGRAERPAPRKRAKPAGRRVRR